VFIRHAVAHDVVARMLYKETISVQDAVKETIAELPDEQDGVGGLIALDREGNHAFGMSEKTRGMYRGYVTKDGDIYVTIYGEEPLTRGGAVLGLS
jgi:isoaspartyl peptidase/L-asparaginase-like protein (Ntn-hydrolase superfamily)